MENIPLPPEDKFPRRKRFIVNFVYFLILFGLSILFVRYALPHLWAFVIAFIVVRLLRKPALAIHKHWKVDYKTASVILVLLFYATIGVAVTFLIIGAINKIGSGLQLLSDSLKSFLSSASGLPVAPAVSSSGIVNSSGAVGSSALVDSSGIIQSIENGHNLLSSFEEQIESIIQRLFDVEVNLSLSDALSSAISSLTSILADFSKTLLSKTTNIALSFSSVIINIFVCIVSTAFGLMDYNTIKFWVKDQLPPKRSEFWESVVGHLSRLLGKYILSYGLIMLITYAELSAGLGIILQDKKAFVYAAVIAVFDILPIIGSGLFLFPWAVISMFTGSIGRGIGLLILWCILSIVRNVIEPRIVGKSVGIHPLVTLFAMIAGQFIYGGIGILLCPVTVALIHTLNSAGVIHLYNVPKQKEEPERTPLGRLLSRPFEWLADKIAGFFVWLFRLIFRKKPHSITEEMNELKAAQQEALSVELADEDIHGSPEASGSGSQRNTQDPKRKHKKQ